MTMRSYERTRIDYKALTCCIFPILAVLLSILSSHIYGQPSPTPAKERLEGIAKRKQLEAQSLVRNVPFRNIGPTIMSGRTVDLDVNPEDPTEFYVAYASGGLWHTRNNGQSFVPVFDNEDVITIGDFVVDWKTRKIWIGTGEVNSSRSSYAGTGVYCSVDTGKTWQYKGLPESHHIGKVIIDPRNPDVVYVAVLGHLFSPNPDRGVYKTTDGGTSWKRILFVDENTGAVDLEMDPNDPDKLFASAWHRERRMWNFVEGGSTSGIYKTLDGGNSWKLMTSEGSGFPVGDGVGRIGISVFPGNSDIVYAVVDNQDKRPEENKDTSNLSPKDLKSLSKEALLALSDNKLEKFLRGNDVPEKYTAQKIKELVKSDSIDATDIVDYLNDANNSLFDTPVIGAELYRSENGGLSWNKTNKEFLKNLYYTYGYYFGKVFVSPVDDKKVILCGVPLVMSSDGGQTFRTIDGDNVHGDHHAVWMNPRKDSHIINCNDGGLNISYDAGASWFKANTPPVGQFYSVNVDLADPYNVYGGLQDNGVWTGSSRSELSVGWHDSGRYPYKFIMGGDGMQVMVDTRDNRTVYTGYQFGNYYRLDKDKDDPDYYIHPRNDIGEPNYRFNWQTPIWLSRHNQDILYFGTNRFHRSMNKGEDMKTLTADLTVADRKGDVPFNTITAIHESPTRFGLLYAGTDDGRVWISKDAGYTFERIDAGLPQGFYVSRITASAHAEGRVYVTLTGCRSDHFAPYLFVSEDYGRTWMSLSSQLPFEPLNVVREDPTDQNLLYIGTDNGLYMTPDRGKTWMAMNGTLPRVAIHDLVVHPRDAEIVIGTHGRSLYVASLSEVRQLTDSVRSQAVRWISTPEMKRSKSWGKKPGAFEIAKTPAFDVCYFVQSVGTVKLEILGPKSTVLVSVTDSADAGLNYFSIPLALSKESVSAIRKNARELSARLNESEDGNHYLPFGEYKLRVSTSSGSVHSVDWNLKDPDAKK
ncbi:MAG: VPS10 domain-containing protein [Bacteroidota bacterium]